MKLSSSLRLSLLLAAIGLAAPLATATGAADPEASTGLEPASIGGAAALTLRARLTLQHPRVGGTMIVDVVSEAGAGATTAAFHVVFDPALLEPVPSEFREGGWLKRGGAATSFLAAAASTGDRVIVGVARLAPSTGARRGGTVCRLAFRALAAGPTALAFDSAHVTSAGGTEVSLRFPTLPLTIRPASRRP